MLLSRNENMYWVMEKRNKNKGGFTLLKKNNNIYCGISKHQ